MFRQVRAPPGLVAPGAGPGVTPRLCPSDAELRVQHPVSHLALTRQFLGCVSCAAALPCHCHRFQLQEPGLPYLHRAQLAAGAGHPLRASWTFSSSSMELRQSRAWRSWKSWVLLQLGVKDTRGWGQSLLLLWVCSCPTRAEQLSLQTVLEQKINKL